MGERWEPEADGPKAVVELDNTDATFTPTGPVIVIWPRQNGKTVISEHINALQARIAELERQRDAVLDLCRRTTRRDLTGYHESPCWPLDPGQVIDLLGGRPVLLDVSRDPQRHPRGEDGQFIERGERG